MSLLHLIFPVALADILQGYLQDIPEEILCILEMGPQKSLRNLVVP